MEKASLNPEKPYLFWGTFLEVLTKAGLGFRACLGLRVYDLGFGVYGFGFRG